MPLRTLAVLSLVLPLLLLALTVAVEAGKYEFQVTGVARSDVLNIRERVEDQATISQAKILGQIPANGTGVLGSGASLRVGKTRWYEVRYKDARGWVNGRFLKPISRKLGDEFEANLFCAGTEPFWALKIDDDSAELSRPDSAPETYTVAVREPFKGHENALALRLVSGTAPEISALVQNKEWCTDGMSDLDYAFEVHVIGLGNGERPLRGCCSLLR